MYIWSSISIPELSKKLGLAHSTVSTQLVLFDKYSYKEGERIYYRYCYPFLRDLKEYYTMKANNKYAKRHKAYIPIVKRLNKMIKEIKSI